MNDRKIRIAFLITDLDVGGAEQNLAALAVGLDKTLFEVCVASLLPAGEVATRLREGGIAVTDVHMSSYADLRACRRLHRWLRRARADLLHTWLFHANFLGRIAARFVGVKPVVSSIRVAEPRRLHLLGERLTTALADCILANSASLRDYMIDAGVRADRLKVIPNAVDLQRFAAARRRAAKAKRLRVLFVGRLTEQKGVDVLLRAAGDVSLRSGIEVVVAGEGPDRSKLMALAEDLELDHVRFVGQTDRVPELLAESDLFVLTSRWEGLPNVVLEAMASRCPVVGTEVTGTRDLIRSGENGLLVPVDDVPALVGALRRLSEDASLRERLAEGGYETARRHSMRAMVEAHTELYLELLKRSRRLI